MFEKASVPQEAAVYIEGDGEHAMLCVRVVHSKQVYRQLLSEIAHSLVERTIVQDVAANPVKKKRRFLPNEDF